MVWPDLPDTSTTNTPVGATMPGLPSGGAFGYGPTYGTNIPSFNVASYATNGVGITVDVTAATQAAIYAAKSSGLPVAEVVLAPGIISTSIDCTNITSSITSQVSAEGIGGGSLLIRGAGEGVTRLIALLSAAYPVFDCIGSPFIHFRDFSVTGMSAGLQTCAFSGGRQATSLLGDHVTLENVRADGTYAKCYASMACDEPRYINCQFSNTNGPGSGVVWERTDYLGVGSAYTTLAAAGSISLTLFEAHDTSVVATSRSCYIMGNFAAAYFTGFNYCDLAGTAQHAIELVNGGGNNLFGSIRVESSSTAASQDVVAINTSSAVTGMMLTGNWQLNGSTDAAPIRFLVNVLLSKAILFPDNIANTGAGTLKLVAGTGTMQNCLLWNPNRLPADTTPTASIVFGIGGSASNVQMPQIVVPDSGIFHVSTTASGDAKVQVKGDGQAGDGVLQAFRGAGTTESIYLLAAAGGGSTLNNLLALVLQNNGTLRDWNIYDYNGSTYTRVSGLSSSGRHPRFSETANMAQGVATLAAGTVTVANTSVTATSRIHLTVQTPGGTVGSPYVSARIAGTSFTITSTSGTDTSTVAYLICEPA